MTDIFIDITNATFNELNRCGKLWVVDEIPFKITKNKINISGDTAAIAYAQIRSDFYRLQKQWLESLLITDIPSNVEKRAKLTHNLANIMLGELAFIIYDAHLLTANILQLMRLLPERKITVFLVGDVSRIVIKTRKYPSFTERALFGVHAVKMQ